MNEKRENNKVPLFSLHKSLISVIASGSSLSLLLLPSPSLFSPLSPPPPLSSSSNLRCGLPSLTLSILSLLSSVLHTSHPAPLVAATYSLRPLIFSTMCTTHTLSILILTHHFEPTRRN